MDMGNKERFCKNNYLDEKVMAEIANIKSQLENIISERMQLPIIGGGSMDNYLICIASGMIQFVCVREGKETYRSLTADHIQIHPGSSMFRTNPLYIVAGEIVRTSRIFAMSISPLTRNLLSQIDSELESRLSAVRGNKGKSLTGSFEYQGSSFSESKEKVGKDDSRRGRKIKNTKEKELDKDNSVFFGGQRFEIGKVKGKKILKLDLGPLKEAVENENNQNLLATIARMNGSVRLKGGYKLLDGEKMEVIIKAAKNLNLTPLSEKEFNRKANLNINHDDQLKSLCNMMNQIMRVTVAKSSSKEMGFICLFTDGKGTYWFKVSRGFPTALNESLASLEKLIDDTKEKDLSPELKEKVNIIYRVLNNLYD
jgi:hypothetical protein